FYDQLSSRRVVLSWMLALLFPVGALRGQSLSGTVTPSSGTGLTQVFQATYTPSSTASTVGFLLDTSTDTKQACLVTYDPVRNRFWPRDDGGKKDLGPVAAGATTQLQNAQCSLAAAASSGSSSGGKITVSISLSFTSIFPGAKNTYLIANYAGNH